MFRLLPKSVFRYSLRTLLLAMSLCCVAMGVWTVYVAPFRNQSASVKRVTELGGESVSSLADGPAWQRWLVETMVGPREFVNVQAVDLRGCRVAARDVAALAGLRYLKSLHLDRAEVTDDSVAALANMTDLEYLQLTYTKISDVGLARLANLEKLKTLYLTGAPVSDSSINTLASMPSLQELYVRWTRISTDGALTLQKTLPNCAVYHHEVQRPSQMADEAVISPAA